MTTEGRLPLEFEIKANYTWTVEGFTSVSIIININKSIVQSIPHCLPVHPNRQGPDYEVSSNTDLPYGPSGSQQPEKTWMTSKMGIH